MSRFILSADAKLSCLWIYPLRLYIILYLFGSSQFLSVYSHYFFLNFLLCIFFAVIIFFLPSIIVFLFLLINSSKFTHFSMLWMKYFLVHLLVYLLNLNLGIIGTQIYFPHLSLASHSVFGLKLIMDVVVSYILESHLIFIFFFGFLCLTFYFSEFLFTWICDFLYSFLFHLCHLKLEGDLLLDIF